MCAEDSSLDHFTINGSHESHNRTTTPDKKHQPGTVRLSGPAGVSERGRSRCTEYTTPEATTTNPKSSQNVAGFYDALRHGFSVVPGIPGTKKAYVSWKPYQTRRATPQEVAAWLRKYPDANPLVITGKVSGVIVLDVDGWGLAIRSASLPPS